jgi:hypothetical protein
MLNANRARQATRTAAARRGMQIRIIGGLALSPSPTTF